MIIIYHFNRYYCLATAVIHVKKLQEFMTEIYKSLNNMKISIVLEFHTKVCEI